MSELHLLDILAARHGCFISDLNLTPYPAAVRPFGRPVRDGGEAAHPALSMAGRGALPYRG